jgi:AraC-like DNA-binding protein
LARSRANFCPVHDEFTRTSQPCYSARQVVPFVRLLRRYPSIPANMLERLAVLDPDARLPIATVHDLLRGAVAITGDPDLGLKAAREISSGDYGALEYAVRSSPTWGAACEVVGRYMRLVNDVLHFSLRTEGERTSIRMDTDVPLPRTAADFQVAAFHVSASFFRSADSAPQLQVWFTHAAPHDVTEYERTFGAGVVRFEAPFNGFHFPRQYLDSPVEGADPKLHEVIRKHVDNLVEQLPTARSLSVQVRDLIAKQLKGGTPSALDVARALAIGPRTLARKLEQEHTTFKQLLDDVRGQLATRYVGDSDLAFSEIAFLLGFSQSASFHRAFKRWTGKTPLEYRRVPHVSA